MISFFFVTYLPCTLALFAMCFWIRGQMQLKMRMEQGINIYWRNCHMYMPVLTIEEFYDNTSRMSIFDNKNRILKLENLCVLPDQDKSLIDLVVRLKEQGIKIQPEKVEDLSQIIARIVKQKAFL